MMHVFKFMETKSEYWKICAKSCW